MKRNLQFSCMMAIAAIVTTWTPVSAQAEMMSVCRAEIADHCPAVSEGRGRISACLISKSSKLDAGCRSEVDAVANRSQGSWLLSSNVRNLMRSGTTPPVPTACSNDQGTFCSGADAGNRNMLACLYAHSDRVSPACSSEIRAALQ